METVDLLFGAGIVLVLVALGLLGPLSDAGREIKRLNEENQALRVVNSMQETTITRLRTQVGRTLWAGSQADRRE